MSMFAKFSALMTIPRLRNQNGGIVMQDASYLAEIASCS